MRDGSKDQTFAKESNVKYNEQQLTSHWLTASVPCSSWTL